eukprot:TRINITY_DN27695_c0_g1_i1.p1 TRINITY_DN27695_c0_g1~~TRINITY_DN27695_c0_g1_i1.p1  ORF type:complete len:1269 (+),score=333.56 TRINITY_DN27695_c0_g1_i1:184-3807(+)
MRPEELGLAPDSILIVAQQLLDTEIANGLSPEAARAEALATVENEQWRVAAADQIRDQQELWNVLELIRDQSPDFFSLIRAVSQEERGEDATAAADGLDDVQEAVQQWARREEELIQSLDASLQPAAAHPSAQAGMAERRDAALGPLLRLRDLRAARARMHAALAPFFLDPAAQDPEAAELEAQKLLYAHPCREGMRIDPDDGKAYSYDEFVSAYGQENGDAKWRNAEESAPGWERVHAVIAEMHPEMSAELAELLAAAQGTPGVASEERATREGDPGWQPVKPAVRGDYDAVPSAGGALPEGGAEAPMPMRAKQPVPASRRSSAAPPLQPAVAAAVVSAARLGWTRERWLFENSQWARLYYARPRCSFWRTMLDIAVSVGFRFYFALLLYGVCALTLVVTWRSVSVTLTRLFVPQHDGMWASVGTFSILVMGTFFVGAWATQLSKVVWQWVLLDDDALFADESFRGADKVLDRVLKVANKYPCSPHRQRCAEPKPHGRAAGVPLPLHGLLPPPLGPWSHTLWGLPSGSCARREVYLTVLVFSTTILPVLYGVIRASSEGHNVAVVASHYVVWNLAAAPLLVAAVWGHAWFLAARLKYRAVRSFRKFPEGSTWNQSLPLLSEWGLDPPSVARNLGALALSLFPLIITWWVSSSQELHLSITWIVLGLAVCVLMLAVREAVRDSGTVDKAPYVAAALLIVFVILGFASAAYLNGTSVVVFAVTVIGSQGALLRHGTLRDVAGGSAANGGGRGGEVQNPLRRRSLPQSEEQEPLVRVDELRLAATRAGYDLVPTHGVAGKSWLPCGALLRALVRCPCTGGSAPPRPTPAVWRPPPEHAHWRMPPHWYEDPRRAAASLSAPLMLWLMLSAFVAACCALGAAEELQQPGQGPVRGLATPRALPQVAYPACRLRWDTAGRMGVVDFAFLADLSYASNGSVWEAGFAAAFGRNGSSQWELVRPRGPSQRLEEVFPADFGEENGDQDFISWVHVYNHAHHHHIVIPRSSGEGRHLMRDLDVWGETLALQLLSSLVPPLRLLPTALAAEVADGLGFLSSALGGSRHVLDDTLAPLHAYVDSLACSGCDTGLRRAGREGEANSTVVRGGHVTLAGHGTDGALAAIVASRIKTTSITFGAPGTVWLRKELGGAVPNPREFAVVSENDPITSIGEQAGAVQRITCRENTMTRCHRMRDMLCELRAACGDQSSRPDFCP